ncbi:hypothetical protein ACWGJX_06225 [Streptomyces sp. NPDC054775]
MHGEDAAGRLKREPTNRHKAWGESVMSFKGTAGKRSSGEQMPAEIVTAAAGVIGKAMSKPATDAALRKEAVIRAH